MNEVNNILENLNETNGILLKDLLGGTNKIFEIPLFQRNYNWTVDNCRELYDDIINSYELNTSHFIGIFIHYNSSVTTLKTSNVLIDGQQRLTTIMLLLCAIRDVTYNEELKSYINKNYIFNSNENIRFKFKLKQNNYDNDNFEKVLDNKLESIQTKSKIYINYSKFVTWLSDDSNKLDLSKLLESIKRMEAVEIQLRNDNIENVQQIFEKINSTGQPLSAADLIRNYLLFTGDMREQQELYNKWTCIEQIVGTNNITQFVRAYTIRYSYEVITSRNIYMDFKKQFKSWSHNKILNDMLKYSVYYAIIKENVYCRFDSEYTITIENNDNKHMDNTLKMLDALGTDDFIPLFFQLFDLLYKSSMARLDDILELVLEFMIRYRVVQPSAGGGALQSKIYGIMKSIDDKECPATVKGIYSRLSAYDSDASRYPTDTQFMAHLKENMLAKNGRVLLYQYARRRNYEIMDFDQNITLEHLMPQTIDSSKKEGKWWINNLGKSKYKEVQEKFTDCIGNYALLTRSLNASISNGPWPNKRKEMLTKAFDMETRKVAGESKWNAKSIKDRNDRLSNEIRQYITGPKGDIKNGNNWLL